MALRLKKIEIVEILSFCHYLRHLLYINVRPTLEKLPALSELLPLLESDLEGIDKIIYKIKKI